MSEQLPYMPTPKLTVEQQKWLDKLKTERPAPRPPSVTPDMVERALDAYDLNSIQGPSCPIAMRAALAAALSGE